MFHNVELPCYSCNCNSCGYGRRGSCLKDDCPYGHSLHELPLSCEGCPTKQIFVWSLFPLTKEEQDRYEDEDEEFPFDSVPVDEGGNFVEC